MSDMRIFNSIQEFQAFRKSISPEVSVGFVPTMGALHEGHASLLRRSVDENDMTVLSIFVNPTQFNDKNDFNKYPKTWDADIHLAKACGVAAVIAPAYDELYADNYRYKISESEFSKKLCGVERIGHFDGVLTVVMKLLNIVQAQKNYFGEKDFQQLKLISDMAKTFFLPMEIIGCATLREKSGLAMSSRNLRLSDSGKEKAALIYKVITECKTAEEAKNKLNEAGFKVEYLVDEHSRRFVAAHLEGVRLIDNVQLK